MSQSTSIEWTDCTWNPVRGCSRVSEGCRNCYAERIAARFNGTDIVDGKRKLRTFAGFAIRGQDGPHWTGRVELIKSKLSEPLHWKKPRRCFVNSMSDLFHENLQDEAIDRVFAVMALTPHITYQVLTKRAERMQKYFTYIPYRQEVIGIVAALWSGLDRHYDGPGTTPGYGVTWKLPLPNVWLGVSVENEPTAQRRIPELLKTPAAVQFVSYEPALGPVDFAPWLPSPSLTGKVNSRGSSKVLDWVIAGGESGPQARPASPEWFRSIRDQCQAAGVPFFFKQWGKYFPIVDGASERMVKRNRIKEPKSVALLDGREWKEFPKCK